MPPIHVCTLSLLNPAGLLLVVRKRGTTAWMLPGGKPEVGETPEQTVIREVQEELHLTISPDQLHFLGQFSAAAANEPGRTVTSDNFTARCNATIVPHAEIEEVRWIDPAGALPPTTAPLLRDHQIPALLVFLNT